MIKAVIFDFFDVIRTDGFQAWMKSHSYTREDAPGDVSRKLDKGEINERQFYEELARISGQTTDEVEKELSLYENDFNTELIQYIIEEIKPRLKTAVVSNAASEYLRTIIAKHSLEPLFDEIVISSEVGVAKPDKQIFEHAIKSLEVAMNESVFVDDNPNYTQVAGNLGMKTILYTDFEGFKKELETLL